MKFPLLCKEGLGEVAFKILILFILSFLLTTPFSPPLEGGEFYDLNISNT
jgi:hypothetical protein